VSATVPITVFSYNTLKRTSEILGTKVNERAGVSKIFFTGAIGTHFESIVPFEIVISVEDGVKRI